uniref:Methyltransferase domain-containing protein n=1 Tax=Ignisphaera aggregans TaxID=334771 RepID=A0A7J2U2A3_9CREN
MAYTVKETLRKRNTWGDVVVGDATSMPIRSDSINVVVAIALVHHLPKELVQKFFIEVNRVSKPRGMLLATVWLWKQRRFLLQITINLIKTFGAVS